MHLGNTDPDNTPLTALDHYEALQVLSERMLEYATELAWDKMAELMPAYTEAIRNPPSLSNIPSTEADACKHIIEHLIDNEVKLKELIEPEQNELRQAMAGLKKQTTVLHTYSVTAMNHER